mgnify:FL=1
MARLERYSEEARSHLMKLPCPTFDSTPFTKPPPLKELRLALVSTAGLHPRGDRPFGMGDGDYRLIPRNTPANELVMSHISTNFDRTCYQQDLNVVFPLDRLNDLVQQGKIESVAEYHYSFMGATEPEKMEPAIATLSAVMKKDGINAVLLVPV